ncbi:unnamed protein product, partial [Rotaria sordida]
QRYTYINSNVLKSNSTATSTGVPPLRSSLSTSNVQNVLLNVTYASTTTSLSSQSNGSAFQQAVNMT